MAAPSGRFDSNLGDIMQNVRQVDEFLDVIFEFLYRRTDFYRIMRHENDSMGLPPGVSRKYVMQAYMKYERLARGVEPTDPRPVEKTHAAPVDTDDVPIAVASVDVTATDVADLPGNPRTVTDPSSGEVDQETGQGKGCNNRVRRLEKKESLSSKTSSSVTKREGQQLNKADTYNGGLRDNYAWSQTLKDVDLKVFVPKVVTKGKQLIVDIKNDYIKVAVKSSSPSAGQAPSILAEGKLREKIRCEESLWSLDPGNCVQLNLEKRTEVWWKAVFVGEPEIDQKSIDNIQYVHEMDEESQADYQRVMYDMERKRQGLPTSKEEEAHSMLRKAWNAEGSPFKGTDYDPSKVNISAS